MTTPGLRSPSIAAQGVPTQVPQPLRSTGEVFGELALRLSAIALSQGSTR